jgi:hypothetical protein
VELAEEVVRALREAADRNGDLFGPVMGVPTAIAPVGSTVFSWVITTLCCTPTPPVTSSFENSIVKG